jgi:hypothetical protein
VLFKKQELQLLDYMNNAIAYMEGGRYRAVNRRMACPLLKSILTFLEPSNSGPKAYIGISHAGAIKPLLAILNVFASINRIEFSLKESFCDRTDDDWNVSKNVPFNSNFNFVLYERNASAKGETCQEADQMIGSKTDQYFVLTLLNERPIELENCSQILCPWSEFKEHLTQLSEDCDLKKICNV